MIFSVLPTVQPLNLTKLGALDDRNLGALIVRNNGSIVNFSLDVMGDPCPGVVWIFNDIMLGSSNNTFMYNNPCRAVDDRNSIWTYTLNVLLTLKTSGKYSANFTNIAGTAFLLRAYFTVPGMFINTYSETSNFIQSCSLVYQYLSQVLACH